jgi:hypothetical protein
MEIHMYLLESSEILKVPNTVSIGIDQMKPLTVVKI